MPAPIALFVYSRPAHTRRMLEALEANYLADQTDLFIFSDAPRTGKAVEGVKAVRNLIRQTWAFRSITLVEREQNWGLSASIIDGVTRLCDQFGQVIVVEDDLVTSPYFLTFLNNGLDLYRNEPQVASIHGYSYPVADLPETFFLRGADCWGWATWKRAWDHFEPDGRLLLNRLHSSGQYHAFNYDGAYDFQHMLEDQIVGKNDSWAIRWYAAAFLDGMLTLYPGKSLVLNIGNDSSGTHAESTDFYDGTLTDRPIHLDKIKIGESIVARTLIVRYVRGKWPKWLKAMLAPFRALWGKLA